SMIDGVEVRPVDLVARPETSSIRGIELGGNAEQVLEPRLLVCCQLAAPGLETLEELRDGNHVPAVGGDEPGAPRARNSPRPQYASPTSIPVPHPRAELTVGKFRPSGRRACDRPWRVERPW